MRTETAFNMELPLPQALYNDLRAQPELLVKLLPEELKLELNNYLIAGIKNKDGGPSVIDLEIRDWVDPDATVPGTFRLYFRVHRNFTCSAIEAAQLDYLDFTFSYRLQELQASATYFYWDLEN